MEKITWKQCPLCGGEALQPLFTCKDHSASGETFPLQRCSACGFTFTQGIPDESEIGPYYDFPEYVSHSDTSKGIVFKLYHAARSLMLRSKRRTVCQAAGRTSGRLLDYGAGTGYFAHAMQRGGWQVTAVEKSESARAFGQQHFGLGMKPEDDFYRMAPDQFDAVTLWHVMEHVQPLDRLWTRLSEVLTSRGTLIVAVPNAVSADALYYKEMWAAWDVPRHLWHFTPDTMEAWGAKHGFRLEAVKTMPLDAFYISMLSEEHQGSQGKFIKGMWRGFVCLLRTIGRKEACSSLIYVFKKG